MPRKIRPSTAATKDNLRIRRQTGPMVVETGDAEKDGPLWMSRILKTLQTRIESDNGDRHWAAYHNWFNGRQWENEGAGKNSWELYSDSISSIYTINIVQSIASAYMPFLLNGRIEFKVKPKKPSESNAAEIHTGLLNYEWKERDATEQVKLVIDDVVIIGHGIAETAYCVEVDEARRKDQGNLEYRDYVKRDAAYVEWLSPFDFIQDLTARDGTPKTAQWCAKRFYVPYDDLVANKRYSKRVTDLIQTGTSSHNLTTRSAFRNDARFSAGGFFGKDLGVRVPEETSIAVWEIWDKKHRQVITMAEGLPYPLDVEEWRYPYLDGFPFTMIQFLRAKNLLYPIGVARQLHDPQLQSNRIRTQQILNVRAQKNMFGYVAGQVDKTSMDDFANLPALSAIPMEREGALFALDNPPMNKDALILEQAIAADAQRITGADALFQGQPLPDRTTGIEVATRTNLVRLKADDKVANVEGGVTEIATQMLQHLKANRVVNDVVEVVGLLGSQWREYTFAEIQAETDVEVEYFSAPQSNPEVERQQKTQVVQVAAQIDPLMAQSGSPVRINFAAAFAWLLKSFPDIKDAGRFFQPALSVPPPLEETAEPAGTGLQPALAGQLAPAQVAGAPSVGVPGEGTGPSDLLMQIFGGLNQ